MSEKWTTEKIGDQSGRVAIVSGANSGIGYETAKALAEKGAQVIMACRNRDKARVAAENIRGEIVDAKLQILRLDLADLESVHEFAARFKEEYGRLDLLINNAGIMIPPLTMTKDGFEVQFGANHLGHFALTGLLMDILLATPNARVVNVSSSAAQFAGGTIDFDNLNAEKGYNASGAYAQSKLANLLFTQELNRKFEAMNASTIATAAHPGWTVTNLQRGLMLFASKIIGQSPLMGALPTLRAAVSEDGQADDYYGPGGFMEMRGYPVKVNMVDAASDAALAKKLWEVSGKMTSVSYNWEPVA